MNVLSCLIPALFLITFVFAAVRNVNVYESFIRGAKKAPPLILSVFPYIAAVTMISSLFEKTEVCSARLFRRGRSCGIMRTDSGEAAFGKRLYRRAFEDPCGARNG